jgi:hypothetical protein
MGEARRNEPHENWESAIFTIWLYHAVTGALAQLGERRLCKPEVTGSIPVRSIEESPGNGALLLPETQRKAMLRSK